MTVDYNKKQLSQELSAQAKTINNSSYMMERYLLGINEQTLAQYQQGQNEATRLYQQAVPKSSSLASENWDEELTSANTISKDKGYYHIGNWTSENETFYQQRLNTENFTTEDLDNLKNSTIKQMPKFPSQTLPNSKISTVHQDSLSYLAAYNADTNTISFNYYSDAIKQQIENSDNTSNAAEYIKGNLTAQYTVYYHEKVHYDHYNYDGMGKLYKTPTTATQANRLTETTAYAAEYLAAANLYTNLKAKGIKTTEYDGKTVPIENILTQYPNLKETIDKNGFNPTDLNNIHAVVKASADNWNKDKKESYMAQHQNYALLGSKTLSTLSWSEQLEALKNQEKYYKEISSHMLQNVDIGQNIAVDLSSCRDLLDTMSKKDAEKLINDYNKNIAKDDVTKRISTMTYDEMKAIDNHLTTLGLTTDKEKMNYMSNYLNSQAYRDNAVKDEKLTAMINHYNPKTTYADGLEQNILNNRLLIKTDDKYYDITETGSKNKTKTYEASKQAQEETKPTSNDKKETQTAIKNNFIIQAYRQR